jgi:hypothetical protein
MLRADRRVVVSHVGSLVRPPAMIPYLVGVSISASTPRRARLSAANGKTLSRNPKDTSAVTNGDMSCRLEIWR